jgi:hypothetical protein
MKHESAWVRGFPLPSFVSFVVNGLATLCLRTSFAQNIESSAITRE